MNIDMWQMWSGIDYWCKKCLNNSIDFQGYIRKFIWKNRFNEILISLETIFRHISFVEKQPGCKSRSNSRHNRIELDEWKLPLVPRNSLLSITHVEADYLPCLRLYLLPSLILLVFLYELDSVVFKRFLQVTITCRLAWNVTSEIAKSRWMSTQGAWLCITEKNCSNVNCRVGGYVRTGSLSVLNAKLPS